MEAFVVGAGVRLNYVRSSRLKAATCGRSHVAVRVAASANGLSSEGSVGTNSLTELERALTKIRAEAKCLEDAAKHLRKAEKDLIKATKVLRGESSSSSSSSEEEEMMFAKNGDMLTEKTTNEEKKKMRKMEERAEKRQMREMKKLKEMKRAITEETMAKDAKTEVWVCEGKACARNGSAATLDAAANLQKQHPQSLCVEATRCMGLCKGKEPTVSINGDVQKLNEVSVVDAVTAELKQAGKKHTKATQKTVPFHYSTFLHAGRKQAPPSPQNNRLECTSLQTRNHNDLLPPPPVFFFNIQHHNVPLFTKKLCQDVLPVSH